MVKLKREDLTDNIVVIKINGSYSEKLSPLELYEVTRGVWKRRLDSVSECEYCLAVANSIVVEVYRIKEWYQAGTIKMQTRVIDPLHLKGRIEFAGVVADDNIRDKYINKSVADLYKPGEADPVKTFLTKDVLQSEIHNINFPKRPLLTIWGEVTTVLCPNCNTSFNMAPRCPECGQLIDYNKWNRPKLKSLKEWAQKAEIVGADPQEVVSFVEKATLDSQITYHLGTVDISLDYKDNSTGSVLKMFLLFGKAENGAIQPTAFYDFVKKCNLKTSAVDKLLEDIRPYLSGKQKNKPYDRLNGYYFIDYDTIIKEQDSILKIFRQFLSNLY